MKFWKYRSKMAQWLITCEVPKTYIIFQEFSSFKAEITDNMSV